MVKGVETTSVSLAPGGRRRRRARTPAGVVALGGHVAPLAHGVLVPVHGLVALLLDLARLNPAGLLQNSGSGARELEVVDVCAGPALALLPRAPLGVPAVLLAEAVALARVHVAGLGLANVARGVGGVPVAVGLLAAVHRVDVVLAAVAAVAILGPPLGPVAGERGVRAVGLGGVVVAVVLAVVALYHQT